jgi:hypothetical protein
MSGDVAINNVLTLSGLAGESFCAFCLFRKGIYKVLPGLTAYLIFLVFAEGVGYVMYIATAPTTYWYAYIWISAFGYLLQIALIRELMIAKVTDFGALPHSVLNLATGILALGLVAASWLVTLSARYPNGDGGVRLFLHVDLAFTLFQTLAFAILLGISRILFTASPGVVDYALVSFAIYCGIALVSQVFHESTFGSRSHGEIVQVVEWIRSCCWSVAMLSLGFHALRSDRQKNQPYNEALLPRDSILTTQATSAKAGFSKG